MENKVLKVDLDLNSEKECLILLKSRLSYFHDLGIFDISNINTIVLGFKSSFNCKIYLNNILEPAQIIIFQLLLGSDWRKEANTILNHYVLNMNYSNRMFDIKIYPGGNIKHVNNTNITKLIKKHVLSKNRKINNN